jgi:hypothetical protein
VPQYEDLATDPWPLFANLAARSTTFQVQLQGTKRDTLHDLAAALEATLERIDGIGLEVPEQEDALVTSVEDGIPHVLDSEEHSLRIEGSLREIDLTIYISDRDLVISVPVETVAPNAYHVNQAPENFQTLVELGLELADLTRARSVYLLDDDDEMAIPFAEEEALYEQEGWETTTPIWERPTTLWPSAGEDDEGSDANEEPELERLFDEYFERTERRLVEAGYAAVDANDLDDDIEGMFVRGRSREYAVVGYTRVLDPELLEGFAQRALDTAYAHAEGAIPSEVHCVVAAAGLSYEAWRFLEGDIEPDRFDETVVFVGVDLTNGDMSIRRAQPEGSILHRLAGDSEKLFSPGQR